MISDTDALPEIPPAPVLWITGLSGAGKSTLARACVRELQMQGVQPLLLDGDLLRDALDGSSLPVNYSADGRLQRAWRIARLARMVGLQGIPVVVATISLFQVIHSWNRKGPLPYAEVLLNANPDRLRERRPELYGSTTIPSAADVVGKDIVAEYPPNPELVLEQRFEIGALQQHVQQVLGVWSDLLLQCRAGHDALYR